MVDAGEHSPAPAAVGQAQALQAGDVLSGRYRIERGIGSGGGGQVFEATRLDSGRRVALKWLAGGGSASEGARKRFLREGQVIAQIDDPHVVQIFDYGEDRGGSYMVMELLQGRSLDQRVREGPCPEGEAVDLMIAALRGLSVIHARGVVHRDLKPENIFLCQGKQTGPPVKILDFGVSKLIDVRQTPLTHAGSVIGTPRYMAPEQAQGRSVDQRADVYSAGVILYELLAGRPPFEGATMGELLGQIVHGRGTPLREHLPQVSPRLEHVVARAMALRPEDRYPDIDALLQELLEHRAGSVRPPVISSRPPEQPARGWLWVAAGMGLGLLLAGLAWWLTAG